MNQAILTCTAVLAAMVFGLGLTVSLIRTKYRRLCGHPLEAGDLLHRAVRAHGNTIEYAPMLAVLFLWHGAHGPADWIVWTIVLATIGRVLAAIGILAIGSMDRPNPVRFSGALLTYACGLVLAATIA